MPVVTYPTIITLQPTPYHLHHACCHVPHNNHVTTSTIPFAPYLLSRTLTKQQYYPWQRGAIGFFTSSNCMLSIKRLGKTNTCLVVNVRERSGRYCELAYCWVVIGGCERVVVTSGGCSGTAVTSDGSSGTAVNSGGCKRFVVTSGDVAGLQ